jgi:membrane-bound inhibitor of C-type lysozyme
MLRAPVSVVAWACDGNPANEVVTLFYATTQPSVRFERGDSIDVGVLTPSATGTRYDGSFGRFIWIEGDTATYRDPDPDATEMTCVPQT